MSERPTDWDAVARAKLTRVLGERTASLIMNEALGSLGLSAVTSADDMRRLADFLAKRGGFAGAVGGLLSVHAAMYEGTAG